MPVEEEILACTARALRACRGNKIRNVEGRVRPRSGRKEGRRGAQPRTAVELLYMDFPINSTYRYRYLIYGNYYIGISLQIVPTSIGTSDLQSHFQYLEVQLEPVDLRPYT
jgi:hypothetical protein